MKEVDNIIIDLNQVLNLAEDISENIFKGLREAKFIHIRNISFLKKACEFNSELIRLLIKFDHDIMQIKGDTTCSNPTEIPASPSLKMGGE